MYKNVWNYTHVASSSAIIEEHMLWGTCHWRNRNGHQESHFLHSKKSLLVSSLSFLKVDKEMIILIQLQSNMRIQLSIYFCIYKNDRSDAETCLVCTISEFSLMSSFVLFIRILLAEIFSLFRASSIISTYNGSLY